jgi:hypothetical protein
MIVSFGGAIPRGHDEMVGLCDTGHRKFLAMVAAVPLASGRRLPLRRRTGTAALLPASES